MPGSTCTARLEGEVREAAKYDSRARLPFTAASTPSGETPLARSKLGLNLARTAQSSDLARQWAEDDEG